MKNTTIIPPKQLLEEIEQLTLNTAARNLELAKALQCPGIPLKPLQETIQSSCGVGVGLSTIRDILQNAGYRSLGHQYVPAFGMAITLWSKE